MSLNRRLELHSELQRITGLKYLYFQPPESIKIHYPCVIYQLADIGMIHADDAVYKGQKRYTITIVDKDPDSDIPEKLYEMAYVSFDRFYTADNLNHWVFTIYY